MKTQTQILLAVGIALAGLSAAAMLLVGSSPHETDHAHEHEDKPKDQHEDEHASPEGHVELSSEAALAAGIRVEEAGPRAMAIRLAVMGEVRLNEDTTRHLSARYDGVVRELRKRVGDTVRAGETVAIVEGNQSLQGFSVQAVANGVVLDRHVASGETVQAGAPLFRVADPSTVWVDFAIYAQDIARVRVGQKVRVQTATEQDVEGTLSFVSPVGHLPSQTFTARAVMKNVNATLAPGRFVSGAIVVDEAQVAVAVKAAALQTLNDVDVVFKQRGEVYEAAPVQLGISDGQWVQVLSGLNAKDSYVAVNSFVLKAELGKSSAAHDH